MNSDNDTKIINIPIEDILPNRFQPRLKFDEDGLNELASSIKEHGIIQPLVLRKLGDKYEIIAGERRYKASKIAGLMSVPAIITTLDDKKSAEVAIVENIQRRNLTSIEEAKSYKKLLDKGYLTQEDLAKKMGISQSAISNKLRLLTLSDSIQNALIDGKISERHARSLLKIANKNEQEKLLQKVIEDRLTVKDLDKMIKDLLKNDNIDNSDNDIEETNKVPEFSFFTQKEERKPGIFFNVLEEEEVNMNVDDTTNNTFNTNNSEIEDIELLDFAPISNDEPIKLVEESKNDNADIVNIEKNDEIISEEKKHIDLSDAKMLIDNLMQELSKHEYMSDLEIDDNDSSISYTIVIKK